jgi:small membrane protein
MATMWIQIILVVALLGVAFYLLRARETTRHLAIRRTLVLLALVVGIVIIIAPGLLSLVAHALGIGRGTDLLLYAFIVVSLFYVVTDYKRSLQQSRTATQLARELTLTEARLQDAIEAAAAGPQKAPTVASTKRPAK